MTAEEFVPLGHDPTPRLAGMPWRHDGHDGGPDDLKRVPSDEDGDD